MVRARAPASSATASAQHVGPAPDVVGVVLVEGDLHPLAQQRGGVGPAAGGLVGGPGGLQQAGGLVVLTHEAVARRPGPGRDPGADAGVDQLCGEGAGGAGITPFGVDGTGGGRARSTQASLAAAPRPSHR